MTTSKPQIKIVDCLTGEEVTRNATNSEIAEYKIESDSNALKIAEDQAQATARAAILDRLGLTAEEAAILLG